MTSRSPRALVAAAALLVLLTGCQAAATTAPTPSAAAAPAAADGYGLLSGSGPVEVQLWTDLSCPYCMMLEAETGELLTQWVEDDAVTLTIHPLNFVSAKRGDDTDWSTRAANALAATADAGQGDRLAAFYAILQQNQVSEAGAPTDEDILAFAAEAGVTADISDAVASQRFGAWVTASNEHWLGRAIDGTARVVDGVPILVVDGVVFEITEDGTNASRLRDAVTAAG